LIQAPSFFDNIIIMIQHFLLNLTICILINSILIGLLQVDKLVYR